VAITAVCIVSNECRRAVKMTAEKLSQHWAFVKHQ